MYSEGAMIINSGDTPGVSQTDTKQTRPAREIGTAGTTAPSSSIRPSTEDSILLSNHTDLVQWALASSDTGRAERIASLRNQIQANQYSVDARALAGSLIDAHLAGD